MSDYNQIIYIDGDNGHENADININDNNQDNFANSDNNDGWLCCKFLVFAVRLAIATALIRAIAISTLSH